MCSRKLLASGSQTHQLQALEMKEELSDTHILSFYCSDFFMRTSLDSEMQMTTGVETE